MKYKRNMVPQMPMEGWHYAKIVNIREGKQVMTNFGPSDTAVATFVTDNYCAVTQSFLMAPGVNFLLERLIDATFGTDAEQVDLYDLVGKQCGIKVEHREWKGKVYANVVDVCAIDELQEEDEDDGFVPPTQEIDLDELPFE